MPVLPPKPPLGGIRCAASPTKNSRPSWNFRATSEVARQRVQPSILTGRSGTPMPERTISVSRASLMSAAALAAATGSTFGSPTVLTPRNPDWQSLAKRKKPPNTELLM